MAGTRRSGGAGESMQKMTRWLLPLAACWPVASAGAADRTVPGAPEQPAVAQAGWQISLMPYAWAAGLNGNVGLFRAPAVHVSADFGDVLKHLDVALMMQAEARQGRLSLFADGMFTRVSIAATTRSGVSANRIDLTSTTANVLVGGGYAVLQDVHGQLDLAIGLRGWTTGGKLGFAGGLPNGARFEDSSSWVDAVAGFRGRYALTETWAMTGWGWIGTGGARLDWDAGAGFSYRVNEQVSAMIGYRALGVDYRRHGAVFDIVQHGPIISLAVRF